MLCTEWYVLGISKKSLLIVQGKRRLEDITAGLTIEPRTSNLVINGQPGSLQFYDVHSEKHVLDLDVSQQSLVSRTDNEEITRFQVVYVAFSADERWMATVSKFFRML